MGSCGTCKHWRPTDGKLGECAMTAVDDNRKPVRISKASVRIFSDERFASGYLETTIDFGCTQWQRA